MTEAIITEAEWDGSPRPLAVKFKSDKQYHEFKCLSCGTLAANTYCDPAFTTMLERQLCWKCNYNQDLAIRIEREYPTMTIIGGTIYSPGNRTSGEFRGMAGRRFDIEYIGASVYAGQRTTTFDLWCGGDVPEALRGKYPDTACFLGGASRQEVADTRCWNPSDRRSEPYPLPRNLRPNAKAEGRDV